MAEFNRILIIKPSSLGDIVHALPALAALRGRFPKAQIAWLVKREWAPLVEGHPELDTVIIADLRPTRWLALGQRLRRERFDLVVDLQGLFRSGVLGWLSGAPERIGFAQAREGGSWFYTQRVRLPNPGHRPWRLIDIHAVDRNLAVVAQLGADVSRPSFTLPLLPDAERAVEAKLRSVHPQERLVAIAPVDRQRIRSWPLDRFVAVASSLAKEPGVRVVLIGTAAERGFSFPFREEVGDRLIDLIGQTTLPELVALLRRVSVLIGNDSAPIHIAAAVGVHVAALFGPTNPVKTRPYGQEHVVLNAGLSCSPCERRFCTNPRRYECLTGISVEQVTAAVRGLISRGS